MRLLLLVFCFLFSSFSKPEKKPYHISGKAQGTTFHLSYYAKDSLVFSYQIDSIFDEIDNSLSIYKDNTLISKFNNADSGIEMDQHMHTVVSKSIEIFNKSGGIFDITVYPLVQLWGFGTKKIKVLPDSASIENAMKCVGTEKIWIEGNRLLKTHPCVKIN